MLRTCGSRIRSSAPRTNRRWISSSIARPTNNKTAVTLRRYCFNLPQRPPSASNHTIVSSMMMRPRQGFRFASTSIGHRTLSSRTILFQKASVLGASVFAVSLGVGWAWAYVSSPDWVVMTTASCEALVVNGGINAPTSDDDEKNTLTNNSNNHSKEDTVSRIRRTLRVIHRLCKLAVVFSPVVVLYPLHWFLTRAKAALKAALSEETNATTDAHELYLMAGDDNLLGIDWYYQLCLFCVEWSGAACIKIMQWAGSRPDMFGREFCAVFSKLQDSTRPHSWKHTEVAMIEAYGENWQDKIQLKEILGSGCIGQVYKGVILEADEHNNKRERPIAVKIMHPCVEDDIEADLDIMRLSIRILETIDFGPIRHLKWLNLPGFIEEMAIMLKTQLDLRKEGEHLVQFNKNFEGNPTVIFPKIIEGYEPTQNVLCETFHDGVPIMEFVKKNKADQKLLSAMCREAIKAICQMIFLDNFTHGDLHPGNVLITDDYKFVLLDVGITTVHSPSDHRLVSDVLASFIRKDGRRAGQYMVDNSNERLKSSDEKAIDEEQFVSKIELISIAASRKNYFMQDLGKYISYICNAASTHHVMLNQAFISSALAVKVQEGIALALDPSIEIWKIAIPIIMEGERRHGRVGERARELFNIDKLKEWVTGKKTLRYKVFSDEDPHGKERVVEFAPNQ